MARKPKVFSLGVPYLTALGPAELKARYPPILQNEVLVGVRWPEKSFFLDNMPNLLIGHARFNLEPVYDLSVTYFPQTTFG